MAQALTSPCGKVAKGMLLLPKQNPNDLPLNRETTVTGGSKQMPGLQTSATKTTKATFPIVLVDAQGEIRPHVRTNPGVVLLMLLVAM